ncbi:hypothetical protein TcarDRAFT_0559 [Thermosinus carboxydivorans Nor1]|uniref:Uncharacterized protein n=1 Tax=Thermosinus carboxydivorans Nor1 TaxID=401526 RepID=A1HSY9_9FIRM|nr:hypothetical protein [Thermosinus carboxydivorans]EAX46871.1 hypothetical protein TcarDRAFT_0559 [Thermosinus carboxydivorans Nor1]
MEELELFSHSFGDSSLENSVEHCFSLLFFSAEDKSLKLMQLTSVKLVFYYFRILYYTRRRRVFLEYSHLPIAGMGRRRQKD